MHRAIAQMEDRNHPYYHEVLAEEWQDAKYQTAVQAKQGMPKKQNSAMRDMIHKARSFLPLVCRAPWHRSV